MSSSSWSSSHLQPQDYSKMDKSGSLRQNQEPEPEEQRHVPMLSDILSVRESTSDASLEKQERSENRSTFRPAIADAATKPDRLAHVIVQRTQSLKKLDNRGQSTLSTSSGFSSDEEDVFLDSSMSGLRRGKTLSDMFAAKYILDISSKYFNGI